MRRKGFPGSLLRSVEKDMGGGNLLWFAGLLHNLTWQMQNMTPRSWGCSHVLWRESFLDHGLILCCPGASSSPLSVPLPEIWEAGMKVTERKNALRKRN